VSDDKARIDELLGAAMRGGASWPPDWTSPEQRHAVAERALYHGIAAILTARAAQLAGWPEALLGQLRRQAEAQAMWELRHQAVLGKLLRCLADQDIAALLLKGSALAYDLYAVPAHRSRGDSDLLIAPADLADARTVLRSLGYQWHPENDGGSDEFALQEEWILNCGDGNRHSMDLHWQLLNAPALAGILRPEECWTDAIALPRLGRGAEAMSHVHTLVHTCVHRAMHLTAPYFIDGRAYYGADRLIWAMDIDLLARSLSDDDWGQLGSIARARGIAPVIRDGLEFARRILGTPIPESAEAWLKTAGGRASDYLVRSRQARRAWSDLLATQGWRRKATFLAARTFPSAAFLRRKYPGMARLPLLLLHGRRIGGLLRPPGASKPHR
jgi:hypothetical protein